MQNKCDILLYIAYCIFPVPCTIISGKSTDHPHISFKIAQKQIGRELATDCSFYLDILATQVQVIAGLLI